MKRTLTRVVFFGFSIWALSKIDVDFDLFRIDVDIGEPHAELFLSVTPHAIDARRILPTGVAAQLVFLDVEEQNFAVVIDGDYVNGAATMMTAENVVAARNELRCDNRLANVAVEVLLISQIIFCAPASAEW